MSNSQSTIFIPLFFGAAYTLLLLIPLIKRGQKEQQTRWFIGYLTASVIWELVLFISASVDEPASIPDRLLLVGTLMLGMTTAVHVAWQRWQRWLVLGGIAVFTGLLVDIFAPKYFIPYTATTGIHNHLLLSILTWVGLNGSILVRTWRSYQQTRFPWHANRQLFWLVAVSIVAAGELLLYLAYLSPVIIHPIGQSLRLIGVIGLTYAVISHRIFDVRTRAQRTLATLLTTLISAIPILAAILLVEWLTRNESFTTAVILTVTVVAVGFFLYQPIRQSITGFINRTIFGEGLNPGQVLRSYSQAVSRTLDVQELSLVIIGMLNEIMGTSRGALILASYDAEDESYEIEPVPALGHIPRTVTTFPANGRFLSTLLTQHQPLLQYEIDFNPQFTNLKAEEQEWLENMAMEAYVPVSAGEQLDGIIAVGPKSSGLPYQPGELELLQTMADQTVVALQNARLYSELGTQNEKIRLLNVDLVEQNERLEIMDKVKTDFITIASHELRTPLTQVKGYSDILSAMNDENSLTREQTREIVGHINRATLRLEGLITAMLDASQLDVDGMKLTFVQTTLDTVMRLASEPILQAIRERQITLEMFGVSDIPPFYADFKRLVQCFTNILSNAVKYTPDHGRITINASMVPNISGEEDHIEIVVTDTGIGIDPRYHELVFEKFFRIGDPQLHSTGTTKFKGAGPGLGLPIAKGVIEAHGGRIWVESEGEDEERLPGSSFYIILPVHPPTMDKEEDNKETERPPYLFG